MTSRILIRGETRAKVLERRLEEDSGLFGWNGSQMVVGCRREGQPRHEAETRALEVAHIRGRTRVVIDSAWVGNRAMSLLPATSLPRIRATQIYHFVAGTLQRCFSAIGETCEGRSPEMLHNCTPSSKLITQEEFYAEWIQPVSGSSKIVWRL